MKRIFLTIAILVSILPVNSMVVNADLDDILKIGLEQNQDIKIKRIELETYQKDIKIANRLQNPQVQSNVVIGNVALGNCSQAGLALPIEVLEAFKAKANNNQK